MLGLLILFGLLAILVFWLVGIYNGLIRARRAYENAFAQIDVQLTRRYDLIPNLVETAKAYMKHESQTLEAVVAARNAAMNGLKAAQAHPGDAGAMQALAASDGQLTGALGRLMAVAEAYPDLKANQNMLKLQEELASTENKISFARQAYNDAAMRLNNAIEQFPNSVLFSSFKQVEYFEVESAEERKAVKVSF